MTNPTNPITSASEYDTIISAANQLLTQRMKTAVEIDHVTCISEEERRNRLLRISFANPPAGLPSSLIIKQVVTNEYNSDQIDNWDTLRFFRDWAGAEFLSSVANNSAHGPRFYGGDQTLGFIILEDLGETERSLVKPLLEGNASSAEAALMGYMRRLGKMHADTLGRAAEYETIWRAANPAFTNASATRGLENKGLRYLRDVLPQFDLSLNNALLMELQEMYERVAQPGEFSAFVHADLCPDNMFFIGDDVRLIDFEFGRFGHALIDASYPRMLFPTCWCCNRIPTTLVSKLEGLYRAELSRTCSAAEDDVLYSHGLTDVCGFLLLETLHWQFPPALKDDHQWGIANMRPRILARLAAFVGTATEFERLPEFRAVAEQLMTNLETQWSEVEQLPLYPAFR